MKRILSRAGRSVRRSPRRLRGRIIPLLQTAIAAALAYALAELLLDGDRPAFASIAAVISLGATYGQRRERAVQLVLGVVLGIAIADLIVQLVGTGPLQIGLLVLLAMTAAVLLGGGELLVAEAAVSAILVVVLNPGEAAGFSPDRILQALTGGGVGLLVASLFLPPDPRLLVDRALQELFGRLGNCLQLIASSLTDADAGRASRAVSAGAELDGLVAAVDSALVTARETARFAPRRRGARGAIEPYVRSLPQVDFAVRDTRVLARHASRLLRTAPGAGPHPEAGAAVGSLAETVWALAAAYESPEQAPEVRRLAVLVAEQGSALLAAGGAESAAVAEVVAQIRSTAVDLVRAAELATGALHLDSDQPTGELLVARPG